MYLLCCGYEGCELCSVTEGLVADVCIGKVGAWNIDEMMTEVIGIDDSQDMVKGHLRQCMKVFVNTKNSDGHSISIHEDLFLSFQREKTL